MTEAVLPLETAVPVAMAVLLNAVPTGRTSTCRRSWSDGSRSETVAVNTTVASGVVAPTAITVVPYDRRWLDRLNTIVRVVRGVGLAIIALLAIASALTVGNVVRLAALARRDEIEIMQLVGAPLAYVRGPFVIEGFLQGGAGAVMAILALWGVFLAARARYGPAAAEAFGLGTLTFLPAQLWVTLVLGGMVLGCLGGFVVARGMR